jgi:type I restriction enzyme S subunit
VNEYESWLNDVPAGWEVVCLGRLAETVKRTNISNAPLLSLYLGEGVIPYKADRVVHATSEDTSAYQLVEPGDLVLNNQQAWRGSVAVSNLRGVVSPAYVVCKLSARVHPGYGGYLFASSAATSAYTICSRGVGTIQRNIHWPSLKNELFPVPPFQTQRAIAEYLDLATAHIDELITEQQRFIGLLRQRRQAVLDSEFQRTEGKRSTTVRRVLTKLVRPTAPGRGVITAYRDGQVTLRSNRREGGYTFSETEASYQGIEVGDLVFHALDGFAGAVGVSESRGIATPVYHVCLPAAGDDVEYLALLLRYMGTSGFLAVQAPNVRQRSVDFRNWSTFARVPVALPQLVEQREFVKQFHSYDTKLARLIGETEHNISLAKERAAARLTE